MLYSEITVVKERLIMDTKPVKCREMRKITFDVIMAQEAYFKLHPQHGFVLDQKEASDYKLTNSCWFFHLCNPSSIFTEGS